MAQSGTHETLQNHGGYRGPHAQTLSKLGPWFHNLHLPDGTQTAPNHPLGDFPRFKWEAISDCLPDDLHGKRVLDIGCNAGFYSFALASRGAQVLGIDADPHYLEQARWAKQHLDPHDRTQFRQMSVYELAGLDEQFDIVFFMGVFYHLRYPALGLDLAASKARQWLVFQSLTMRDGEQSSSPEALGYDDIERLNEETWPKMAFIEDRLAGDPTNWWVPNLSCVEGLLRSAGLEIEARPAHEIFLCRVPVGGADSTCTASSHLAAVYGPAARRRQ